MFIKCRHMALGHNVKRLRLARGESFKAVGEAVGTDAQAIQALEKRNSKKSSFAPALATHFNVSLEELHGSPEHLPKRITTKQVDRALLDITPVKASEKEDLIQAWSGIPRKLRNAIWDILHMFATMQEPDMRQYMEGDRDAQKRYDQLIEPVQTRIRADDAARKTKRKRGKEPKEPA